jgi:hypothetical protein
LHLGDDAKGPEGLPGRPKVEEEGALEVGVWSAGPPGSRGSREGAFRVVRRRGEGQYYWTRVANLFADNLRGFLDGQPLLNVVDKELGY